MATTAWWGGYRALAQMWWFLMECIDCKTQMDCLEDFCGGTKYPPLWFDYCPKCKDVQFGGAMGEIPNIEFCNPPTTEEVYKKLDTLGFTGWKDFYE